MIPEPIRELLDELYERYDTPGFIEDDPISVPHGFTRREDIEIAGFLAATIAWGNRRSIVRNGRKLMELMDRSPYDFTMNASRNELLPLLDFVHRTFNGGDCIDFIGALRGICLRDGSLGGYFEREYAETGDLRTVLSRFRTAFWSADHRPRAEKHLSSIDRGASCKRLCMYLKWMVRDDGRGVDFGLWKSIPPAALYLPLDVHTGHMGRALGLLARKQNDWKAVEEITASLRTLDASDPVKYDFALFGAGIDGFPESVPSARPKRPDRAIRRLRGLPFVAGVFLGTDKQQVVLFARPFSPRKEHSENPETGFPRKRKVARPGSRGFPHHLTDRAPLRDMATPLSPPLQ